MEIKLIWKKSKYIYIYINYVICSRQVTEAEAQKFIEEYKLHLFMETSAKTGFNAQQLFIEAAKVLYIDFLKYNRNVS